MQREILFVGRLRRGEKKEDLIGVLSRTVFVEEKKKDTSVAWPVCRAAEKHTEIWGSKPHLQSRSCKTFESDRVLYPKRRRDELGTLKNLTYGFN